MKRQHAYVAGARLARTGPASRSEGHDRLLVWCEANRLRRTAIDAAFLGFEDERRLNPSGAPGRPLGLPLTGR